MSNQLRQAIRDTWHAALQSQHRTSIPEVADAIMLKHDDLIKRQGRALVLAAIKRYLNCLAKIETDRDSLLPFGFPEVIAIPDSSNGYFYMQTAKARWDDLVAGQRLRDENLLRAQQKLDSYRAALDAVRPIMEGTRLTLAEAYQRPRDGCRHAQEAMKIARRNTGNEIGE